MPNGAKPFGNSRGVMGARLGGGSLSNARAQRRRARMIRAIIP
jgi:hypothetical protein